MAAYFVVDIHEITDPEAYAEYRKGVNATLQQYNGKFLVRGGAHEVIEGEWSTQRLVIVEFESKEQFARWYHSPEYSQLLKIRLKASSGHAVLVEGV